METPVDSDRLRRPGADPTIHLRLLGPVAITRAEVVLPLPASRKVRGLAAYLALAPHPVARSQLCDLLWEIPNDPRGELRWCLSKLRRIFDEPGRRRVESHGDAIGLDLADCRVDALEVAGAAEAGIETLAPDRLRALSDWFRGDFLDGLEIGGCPQFGAWVAAQRRRFRACHAAILEHLLRRLPDGCEAAFRGFETWLRLAPFDRRAHELLLEALARQGRIGEGEEHLAATARLFEAEGLDPAPIRDAWRAARLRHARTRVRVPAVSAPASQTPADTAGPPPGRHRASIAVMPFVDRDGGGGRGGLADGLAHDVITRLAKLRSLFVIAQGTVFALAERRVAPEEVGRTLDVDYVVSGSLLRRGNRITASVELVETRTARIIWTEVYDSRQDDAFLVLEQIGTSIVASIVSEIDATERNRAILKPPSSLTAWEAYHRGVWYMYRYNKADLEQAQHFLEMAIRLDPTFARAYAALSFTHWQNAFQRWQDREPEIDRAFETAGQSLIVDDRDPAAHWAMGRALWLRGQQDQGLTELDTAVQLSPSFAHGHYTLAFVHAQSGDARAAIGSVDYSRLLSPYDPLLFAMLATRAMALVRLGRLEEAADWAGKAALRPNAFSHIQAMAAALLALTDRQDDAEAVAAALRRTVPGYRIADLLATFRFSPDAAAVFRNGARRIGLAE